MRRSAAVFVLLLAGCMDFEELVTLLPDGSGKAALRIGIRKGMLDYLAEQAREAGAPFQDPLAPFSDPELLRRSSSGVAAWTPPAREEADGWVRVSVTAWFEDVSRVKLGGDAGFALTRTAAGGATLEWSLGRDDSFRQILDAAAADPEQLRPLLDGFRVALAVDAPAPIDGGSAFVARAGRRATIALDAAAVLEGLKRPDPEAGKRLRAVASGETARLSWAPPPDDPARRSAFRRDLEAAKKAWAAADVRPTAMYYSPGAGAKIHFTTLYSNGAADEVYRFGGPMSIDVRRLPFGEDGIGRFTETGDDLHLVFAGPREYRLRRQPGGDLADPGTRFYLIKPFDGLRPGATFERRHGVEGVPIPSITLRADGTFEDAGAAAFAVGDYREGVPASGAGTYEFRHYALRLAYRDGPAVDIGAVLTDDPARIRSLQLNRIPFTVR